MNARTTGIKEFRKLAEQAKELFSSRKQTIISYVAKKDKTIIQIDYEGILAADLPNGMKAGEAIKLKGESEFEFKDGKISSITDRS
ncbi:nuclear transport factor 2 family protein [Rhodohalobacter sp. SW132]|uniref:nuclear transport factor 2 family protein n=1 Tax=Rhodohalobacter sp. SW132 TaxID=2293433 RepID=UPI000E233AB0|nr:nuclear transport factor 2 family protein [Rhodohalobacter sp. SW132]REL32923.1 nuclear transport factor 2 family protein [Rhodohalobacter sp. SW132]